MDHEENIHRIIKALCSEAVFFLWKGKGLQEHRKLVEWLKQGVFFRFQDTKAGVQHFTFGKKKKKAVQHRHLSCMMPLMSHDFFA